MLLGEESHSYSAISRTREMMVESGAFIIAWRTTTNASLVPLDAYCGRCMAQTRRDSETAACPRERCLVGCKVSLRSRDGGARVRRGRDTATEESSEA